MSQSFAIREQLSRNFPYELSEMVCEHPAISDSAMPDWMQMSQAEAVMGREEFEGLLKPILGIAFRYANRLAGESEAAMDLVQDASVQAFRARHTFQSGTNFKAWFLKILTNLFYAQRQRKRLDTSPLDDAPDAILYEHAKATGADLSADDPAAYFFNKVDMQQVNEALDRLSDEYREAATLYFVSDLSYEEIADTLDIPIGTVRSRLHRARKQLQVSLLDLARDRGWVEEESVGA